jgi:acetylornithine/N-succinyldiaminopimelate aminotransferase
VFEHGDQGGTYAGNPLMCAVALAVLNELSQPAFLAQVRLRGRELREGLQDLSARLGLGEVRGEGLLLALELGQDMAADVVHTCRERGLLVNAARPHCLRFMPRLNTTAAEVQQGLALLEQALAVHLEPAAA